jgi:hypothetical protein
MISWFKGLLSRSTCTATTWFVPESPYYTASKGDAAATKIILQRICAVNGNGASLPKVGLLQVKFS